MGNTLIRVGVIGTSFGGETHVPAFQANAGSEVVVLCGRDIKKAQRVAKKNNVKHVTSNYKELLDRDDIDVITVSSPPATHYKFTTEAVKKGKHVLCEKPFGLSIKEARSMYEAAKKAGVAHLVGHQMRFQLQRIAIKNIMENGDIGQVLHVNLSYSTSTRVDPNLAWTWWSDIEQGGGELNAIGSHQIDLLRWWFGEIDSVRGELNIFTPERRDLKTGKLKKVTSDELATFHMRFNNGVVAHCSLSSVALSWKGPQIQIYGTKGALFVEGEQNLTMFRKTTATHDLSVKDPHLSDGWVSGSEWRASFARMIDDFIVSIKEKRTVKGATFLDGLEVRKVIEAIRKSNESKQLVKVS